MTQVEKRGEPRQFDGVICFGGEDWWYHNRGHYDMQIMRELSAHVPVLYVNSIGMRVPRVGEGAIFFKRVRRKLKSLRQGLVKVRENFWVFSPVVLPGKKGLAVTRRILPRQIRRAARRAGIRKPLVWVACPPGIEAVEGLDPVGVVYQRTDRFENFAGVDPEQIIGYDKRLKSRADLTLFCSTYLFKEEGADCKRAAYVDHGVDYERFAEAGTGPSDDPEDVRAIPRPRIGFVGGIDSHTFDPELFVKVVAELDGMNFVLVGACSLSDGWCEASNVTMLGQKAYEDVPRYMAACDVLIMPWNRNDWIKACNPVKLKEYLAVGRPIVTTEFAELSRYEGYVAIAQGADEFAACIARAVAKTGGDGVEGGPGGGVWGGAEAAERSRSRVEAETWKEKGAGVLRELGCSGLVCTNRAV